MRCNDYPHVTLRPVIHDMIGSTVIYVDLNFHQVHANVESIAAIFQRLACLTNIGNNHRVCVEDIGEAEEHRI